MPSVSLEKHQPMIMVKSRDDDLAASSSMGIQAIPSLLAADSLPQHVYPQRNSGVLTAGTVRIEGEELLRWDSCLTFEDGPVIGHKKVELCCSCRV